jgi:hypothetical protein
MFGDSLWTGMTIESSGVIKCRDIKALYDETVPAFDSLSRVLGALAAIVGTAAAAS